MSGSGKSEQDHVPHFLHKKLKPGSFLDVSRAVMQINGKEMYKKVYCN